MSLYNDVYGLSYKDAQHKIDILKTELTSQIGQGFSSLEELEEWAHDHLLDKVVYMNMSKKFFYVSHKGELLGIDGYTNLYKNVLFYGQRKGNRTEDIPWVPEGFQFFDHAYTAAEQSDGIHKPLYYRDYTVPSGYYNEERDAFNVAKPFPVFAKETGRDTRHIYTYIEHIAGECAMWLLAWLRAKMLYPNVKTQVVPIIVSRAQGSGKGQPLTSKVLTPNGFKTLGELKDGDLIISPVDAKAYPVSIHNRGRRHINKITMSNGAVTYCDDYHIWQARTVGEQSRHKPFHEMTIEELKSRPLKKHYDTKCGSYDAKQIFIQLSCPINGTNKLLMAYAIGLFIGDGCCSADSIYINEQDVYDRCIESLAEAGYTLSYRDENTYTVVMTTADIKFTDYLAGIGVTGRSFEKHLPDNFLQLDLQSRRKLFEGLIDSDGCVTGANDIDWSTASEQLHKEMYDLASSIGLVVRQSVGKKTPKYQNGTGRPSYRWFIKYDHVLQLSVNHMSKLKSVQHDAQIAFESIEDAGEADCCCIYVDSPDHLYITDDWIVTHNTTFAEVICKGLFGKDNVIVSDQYDSTARFNADYADALIVCQEEKELEDKRNPAGALKSRATATTIRKEQKGVDPIYQESYTDFIMTTNKDVPIKFDGREDQRRFMVMEADEHFTRKESSLADEVFSKLYGYDANFNKVGTPFQEDKDLIAQFKHELFTREDIAKVPLRNFPKTAAYKRCFSIPRTTEATEIESILRALAPFIKASLEQNKIITVLEDGNKLSDVIQIEGAVQLMPEFKDFKKYVALCRPLVFYESNSGKPYPHATVERGIMDCAPWLLQEYGIRVDPNTEPLPGGFGKIAGRYRMAPTARFSLADDASTQQKDMPTLYQEVPKVTLRSTERIGQRLGINSRFKPDPEGCFETVNEMKPGTVDLTNKSQNVQYMDTFLLESDETSHLNIQLEKERAAEWKDIYGESKAIEADMLYRERLQFALKESERIFNDGIACRLVYSGAKSYHLLVRVKDAPTNLEEYAWLHAYLATTASDKLIFDESTSDPARLTRAPRELERTTTAYGIAVEGTQRLVCEDFSHVYDIKWRDLYDLWKKRPLKPAEQVHGKRLIPGRSEYYKAAEAIIDTTFWTDSTWDGERQRCFFPAYRILRLLGYSHEELWDNGLMTKGVEKYKHKDEIMYWKTRYKSSIVTEIDTQIDEYNALTKEETSHE